MLDAAGGHGAAAERRRARLAAARRAAPARRGRALGRLALGPAGRRRQAGQGALFRAGDPMRHASTQDPSTWGSFAAAMGAVAAGEADGAGYVLRDDAEHVFLDLDNCRDPATGAIADWAMRLVEECGSYAEATPSGRGLRIIGLNESFQAPVHRAVAMPEGGRVEIYHRCPRYVTVSGRRLLEAPDELRPICDVAADLLLLAQHEGQGKPDAPPSPAPRSNPDASASPEDIASALGGSPTPTCPGRSGRGSAWRSGALRAAATTASTLGAGGRPRAASTGTPPATSAGGTGSAARRIASASPRCTVSPAWPTRSGSSRRWCRACTAHAATQSAAGGAGDDWEGEEVPNAASQAASAPPAPLTATPFDPAELATLRPREWVYGHFLISRFVSVLGAPGGTGKTAYAVAVGLSVALGRPLLDESVHAPGPVWIYNLEDPRDELLRRVQAALIAHRVWPADVAGRLFLDSGRDRPLVVAARLPDGGVVAMPVVEELIAELRRRGVAAARGRPLREVAPAGGEPQRAGRLRRRAVGARGRRRRLRGAAGAPLPQGRRRRRRRRLPRRLGAGRRGPRRGVAVRDVGAGSRGFQRAARPPPVPRARRQREAEPRPAARTAPSGSSSARSTCRTATASRPRRAGSRRAPGTGCPRGLVLDVLREIDAAPADELWGAQPPVRRPVGRQVARRARRPFGEPGRGHPQDMGGQRPPGPGRRSPTSSARSGRDTVSMPRNTWRCGASFGAARDARE